LEDEEGSMKPRTEEWPSGQLFKALCWRAEWATESKPIQ
jgi:hypothetical protein